MQHGAEPGSTSRLAHNDDEVGTAAVDASGQAIVTPTAKVTNAGGNSQKLAS